MFLIIHYYRFKKDLLKGAGYQMQNYKYGATIDMRSSLLFKFVCNPLDIRRHQKGSLRLRTFRSDIRSPISDLLQNVTFSIH